MQKTPDGGTSRFWYDRLGRLVISQNAYQLSLGGNVYSYTSYDSLGRITEVGQLSSSTPISDTKARSADSLTTWLAAAANTRTQFTQTVYDTAYLGFVAGTFNQANLRNRVSYSKVFRTTADALGVFGTYYSYDIHGNVNTLLQDFGPGAYNAMNGSNNRFKRIDYDYDLISGKVNQVSYQPGRTDAYYHRYAYDGENRLTDVYSGRDTIQLLLFPEREAHYGYYKHGPLARTDLGQLQVQGQDYVYTLQGWLKAVNPVMGGTLVNGTDTTEAFPVAQDVYGYSLHYFKRDYTAISDTTKTASVLSGLGASAAPLFNGNIAAMAVNLPKFGTPRIYNYKYDQLNRLVSMDAYTGLTPTTASFTPVSITDYKETVAYDPNGNIRTYLRNGDAARTAMDNLTYSYNSGTNQLNRVVDTATDATTNYSLYNDIKKGQAVNNYQYDAIGNLISDASEGISKIDWTVYGKINYLVKGADTIRYAYDAAGNRIMKQTPTDTTFYVRDATGNVLSVYTKPAGGSLAQTELHLYGSSRLGMATQHLAPDSVVNYGLGYGTGLRRTFTRGEKLFELSNHLGNVLVTISDRRQQNSAGGTVVDSYAADVLNANDYYPFGMQMPGRKFAAGTSGYRYGFNGKENDNEVKGAGNQQDYGMRIYDPRIGKFLSVDPLKTEYPWYSPYQFGGNTPIQAVDLDGREPFMPLLGMQEVMVDVGAGVGRASTASSGGGLSSFRVGPGGGGNWMNIGQSQPWVSPNFGPGTMVFRPQLTNSSPNQTAPQVSPQKAPTPQAPPTAQPSALTEPPASEEEGDNEGRNKLIYRAGGFTDLNFTPRPGKDDGVGPKSGLSAFVTPEQATQGKGGKVQVLSVGALEDMGLIVTIIPDGHAGIRPRSQEELKKWAATRNNIEKGIDVTHVNTHLVKAARVGEIKVPAPKKP